MADENSTETTPETAPATTATVTEPDTGTDSAAGEPELPEGAQKALAAARKDAREAEKARKAAEKAAETAAETARTEMAKAIGKALGLVEDEKVNPEQLTAQLAAQTAETSSLKTELAVYRAATAAGADPSALLDSRSFLASLDGVDVSDTAAVTEAISAAVKANPALAGAPARRLPAPNPAQGSSAAGAPSVADEIAAAEKAGDLKKVMALKADQLLAAQKNFR